MGERPDCGIYYDVPPAEYFAWDAVSNSRLSLMAKSPRHYQRSAGPIESVALRVGSLAHAGRLEPLELAERYAVQPDYHLDAENVTANGAPSISTVTRYVTEKVAAFREVNADKEIVSREEYDRMKQIVAALHENREANTCLNGPGPVEASIVWDDPETGLRCKARIDKVRKFKRRICDLKTTGNIFKFSRSIADYGYARQMHFYRTGWSVLNGGDLLEPWLIAVESAEPYSVMAAPVGEESLEVAAVECDKLLRQVADCMESGCWPGPPAPDEWELPEWKLNAKPVALTVGGVTLEV